MKIKILFPLILLAILLASCNKEEQTDQSAHLDSRPETITFPTLPDNNYQRPDVSSYTGERPNDQEISERGATISVPPGTNQLQAIIDGASWGDKIVLEAGTHYEDATVVINKRLTLSGQQGAVLSLGGTDAGFVGMYLYDAFKTRIEDLSIVNSGYAFIGIAVELTDLVEIYDNNMDGFTYSILLEEAWHAKVKDNIIVGFDASVESGGVGITVLNGDQIHLSGNAISINLFGIWACDHDGKARDNDVHHNLIGLILCKVPEGSFTGLFSDESTGGSVFPATNWEVKHNDAHHNVWGYLVIDGANNSSLHNNDASYNAFVDIELAAETNLLFGFTTPVSHNNTVNANGAYYIDCGDDNTVTNGTEAGVPCSL